MKNYLKYFSIKYLRTKFTKENFKALFQKIISLKISSPKIALSIALGIFIGLALPIGLQTIAILPLATLMGCNIFLASGAALISNPITVFPIYYSAIKLGGYLTGIQLSWKRIDAAISNPTWSNISTLGNDGLVVFFTGSIIEGIIGAILFYFISLFFVKKWRSKHPATGNIS